MISIYKNDGSLVTQSRTAKTAIGFLIRIQSNLVGLNLADLDLSNMDLSGQDFGLCDFTNTNLQGCDLRGTLLDCCCVYNSDLRGALLNSDTHIYLQELQGSRHMLLGPLADGNQLLLF